MKKSKLELSIIRQKLSRRGGGIEIDLSRYGYNGEKMSAYQNYLGGGILGRVCSDCTVSDWQGDKDLVNISNELKQYFHALTNPDTEWEGQTFEQNQKMAVSAY